ARQERQVLLIRQLVAFDFPAGRILKLRDAIETGPATGTAAGQPRLLKLILRLQERRKRVGREQRLDRAGARNSLRVVRHVLDEVRARQESSRREVPLDAEVVIVGTERMELRIADRERADRAGGDRRSERGDARRE